MGQEPWRALFAEHLRPGRDRAQARATAPGPNPVETGRDYQGNATLEKQRTQDQPVMTGNVAARTREQAIRIRHPCRPRPADSHQDADRQGADNETGENRTAHFPEYGLTGLSAAPVSKQIVAQS